MSSDSEGSVAAISYGNVPNSPVHKIQYRQNNDSDSDMEIVSLQKKARIFTAPIARKRRNVNPALATSNDVNYTLDVPPEESSQWIQDMYPLQDGLPDRLTSFETSYTLFKENLEWDDSMFTQISDTLFIVHGWNRQRKEATVSVRV